MADHLKSIYNDMWERSKSFILSGEVNIDLPPAIGESRWGLSAIIRPIVNNDGLFNICQDLKNILGDQQLVYSETNLHTTLRSIESYRGGIPVSDKLLDKYVDILKALCITSQPFQIHYKGITATTTGVMAQGFPIENTYQQFRENFHKELQSQGIISGPETKNIRQTAHISLAVFTQKLLQGSSLVEYIASHRQTEIGLVMANEIELVFYQRGLTSVSLESLAKMHLS